MFNPTQGQRGAGPLLQSGLHRGMRTGIAKRLLTVEEVAMTRRRPRT